MLGSRDETVGCQLCVATVADDGSLTLRLRMPDCLAGEHGKYLVTTGVRFGYGHEQVLAALECNAQYAEFRRKYGEQAARQSGLGQAISYRFKRDGKGWRVFVTTHVMDVRTGGYGPSPSGRHRRGPERRPPGGIGDGRQRQLAKVLAGAVGDLWEVPTSGASPDW